MCNTEGESSSSSRSSNGSSCWKKVLLTESKLLRGFAFAILLGFVLVLLFSFYLFYVRLRRLQRLTASSAAANGLSTEQAELGLKKELREMLPVIVYKESFSVSDTLCSVCLGEYEAEDRLQQIPSCRHTFHMQCIDHWLSSHSTCPLCRLSLLPSSSSPTQVQ